MKRWIRNSLIGVGVLVGAISLAAAAALLRAEQRLRERHQVSVPPLALPTDAAALEHGRYLYAVLGCGGCHGANGAGQVLWSNGSNVLRSAHIAPGAGSVTERYRPEDWVRAVRHGVGSRGQALLAMPSVDYQRLTDSDLGAVVAHIQRLPAVDSEVSGHRLGLLMRTLVGIGQMPLAPDHLDPTAVPASAVAPGVTLERGRYLAQTCVGCHGPKLAGGPIPGTPPGTPPAANLSSTPDGAMSRYPTVEALQALFKTGRRPDGREVAVMPFSALSQLDDVDTAALHLFLESLPPLATGSR